MAQLVEQLLAIPEVRSSNPVIDKIYLEHLFTANCIEKTKIKKKRQGIAHFYKKKHVKRRHTLLNKLRCLYGRSKSNNNVLRVVKHNAL